MAKVGRGRALAAGKTKRLTLIAANIAAAACVAAALVVLLVSKTPQSTILDGPASQTEGAETTISADGWYYYPANLYGIYRVKLEKTDMDTYSSLIEQMDGVFGDHHKRGVNEPAVRAVVFQDGWLYYSVHYFTSPAEDGLSFYNSEIIRMRADGRGTAEVLMADDDHSILSDFRVSDGWIYWRTEEAASPGGGIEKSGLYKMRLDGSEKTAIKELGSVIRNNGMSFVARDGWIYYIQAENDGGSICKTDSNGERLEWTYKVPRNEEQNAAITPFEIFCPEDGGDWLYYTTLDYYLDNTRQVTTFHRIHMISGESQKLVTVESNNVEEWLVWDGWIYYIYGGHDGNIYRIRPDGTDNTELMGGVKRMYWNLRMLGGDLYYCAYDFAGEQTMLYQCPLSLDGLFEGFRAIGHPLSERVLSADEEQAAINANAHWDEFEKNVDFNKVVEAALARYAELFGDKPMLMYYTDGIQLEWDKNGNSNHFIIDFWIVWSETESYCISIDYPNYTVAREWPDELQRPLAELKAMNLDNKKIFE
ncbi:MAG: DUF5050 domain-containing protein [Clostridiales bacterium]|nr:DUF5050 domain-containing protein [Clostridiales bacterium]